MLFDSKIFLMTRRILLVVSNVAHFDDHAMPTGL